MGVFDMFQSIFHKFSVIFKRKVIRTKYVTIPQVYVPNDFPSEIYQKIIVDIANKIGDTQEDYEKFSEFASAWVSIAYRFTSVTYDNYEFAASTNKFGITSQLKPREREIQDNSLFSFFVNGQSLIESLCYALYILGSIKNPNGFPITPENLAGVEPGMVKEKFIKYFKSEQVTSDLSTIIDSVQYQEIKICRNTLLHRAIPDRQRTEFPMRIKGSPQLFIILLDYWKIPGKIKDKNGKKIDHDVSVINDATISYREWLLASLTKIFTSTDQFVMKDFKKKWLNFDEKVIL